MIRVLLDGVEISDKAEVDLSFVKKLDRELDEGFLVISHTDQKDQFPMFSIIDVLENNTPIFSGRISNDLVELSSFDSALYNHSVSVIEHTKLLEKYLINGKTFTQPIDDTTVPFYTLFDVVEILRTTAIFEKEGLSEVFAPFEIPQETEDELSSIISPEFSFKDVTLRQALDEVANVLNSITRLNRDNEIVFDKFNELLNEIDGVTENYKKQQNIRYYSTHLSSDLINPISQVKDNLRESEYYPSKKLWTTLRSDFGRFDFESSYIPTPKPIYEISEVKTVVDLEMYEVVESGDDLEITNQIFEELNYELDITNNIIEKSKYDTLFEKQFVSGFEEEKTKRNTIFYEYGKPNIQIGKTYGLFNLLTNYRQMLENATFSVVKDVTEESDVVFQSQETVNADNSNDFFEKNTRGALFIVPGSSPVKRYFVVLEPKGKVDGLLSFTRWEGLFRVKYTPVPRSIRYEVVRDDVTEIDLFTNQTINQKLRLVDLESFTDNMKGRINQLGESQLTLSHKVKDYNQSWMIGDFTEDKFVITKKEVIAQLDHYIINYELNKNFNKISQFVGVDQEIRQWEIGESGRTLDRDLNYNEYIEIEADNDGEFSRGENDTTLQNSALFFTTFDPSAEISPITIATFSSPDLTFEDGSPLTINLPFYRMSGGDSFGIYFDFDSNASAQNELRLGDENVNVNIIDEIINFLNLTEEIPRYFNVPVKYTNEIGRLDTFNLSLYDENDFGAFNFEDEIEAGNNFPILNKQISSQPVISGQFLVKKDNRERLKISLQYHLSSKDVNEVVVGKKMSTHNFLSIENPNQIRLRTFKNRTFTKRDNDKNLDDFENEFTTDFLTIDTTNSFLEITKDLSNVDSWALTDENGIPFVMVNGNKKRLVFSFKNKKENIRYLRTGDLERYEPPGVVSTSRTESTISMTLRNNNEDTVIIDAFLSFTIQNGIQVETANPDEEVTLTFTNLEANKTYNFFITSKNTNFSSGLSGNNGLKNSIKRMLSVTTLPLQLDVPVYEFDRLVEQLPNSFDDGRNVQVLFEVTNTNDIPLRLLYDSLDQEASPFLVEEDLSQFLGFEIIQSESGAIIQPDETRLVLSPAAYKKGNLNEGFQFPEEYRFRWQTLDFERNFYSEYTDAAIINISPYLKPIYLDNQTYPIVTKNSIEVAFENPNDTEGKIEVVAYTPEGFRVDTKRTDILSDSVGSVLFEDLQQSTTYVFRAKFLKGFGRLESQELGDPLTTSVDDFIRITTFDDFGAAPSLSKQSATETSLSIRYTNQDTRPVFVLGNLSNIQSEQLGALQAQGDSLTETYTGLRAGEKYTFSGRVRLQDETVFAPDPQTTIFEAFTKPAQPTLTTLGITQTQYAARAFNSGNAYPVEILRNGNSLGTVDPGSYADVLVTGLTPGQNYTFSFVSRLDGTNSDARTFSFQTLGPLSNPVVTVESATANSITPRIQNDNNRFVRAFGRFFPSNLSDLGTISPNSTNTGFTFSDNQLESNRALTFYSKFVDVVDNDFETSVVTTTLYTAPEKPVISNFQFVTAGPDVVEISFDLTNNNDQFGPQIDGTIRVENTFTTQDIAGANLTDITPDSTNNYSFNLSPGDLDSGIRALIEVTFENPTSKSSEEFNGQT